jgi:hypothetical protein
MEPKIRLVVKGERIPQIGEMILRKITLKLNESGFY